MARKKAPINTERQAKERPGMLGWIMGGNPNAILAQEAQGQQSLVGSDTLPTDMGRHSDYDTKAILEAAGVRFLGVVEGDEMFQYVELPGGWVKKPTDHSMWSNLVDDKGRERASIFYKAAFYDRRAHINLTTRFGVRKDYERENQDNVAVARVTDGRNIIHTTDPVQLPEDRGERYKLSDKVYAAAVEWLNQNYPDWKNPGAYWD
jgi:hypothetical protein